MRQIQYQIQMVSQGDYAAYTLTADSPLRPGETRSDYIARAAHRNNPPRITLETARVPAHVSNLTAFGAEFLERVATAESKTFQPHYAKLLTGFRIRNWALTAVEVDPGELRLHLVNHNIYKQHQQRIEQFRTAHPDQAQLTAAEITADLVPYHEVIVCRAGNPVLSSSGIALTFGVPNELAKSHETYQVEFVDKLTRITEPSGHSCHQYTIQSSAFHGNYTALVTEIQ